MAQNSQTSSSTAPTDEQATQQLNQQAAQLNQQAKTDEQATQQLNQQAAQLNQHAAQTQAAIDTTSHENDIRDKVNACIRQMTALVDRADHDNDKIKHIHDIGNQYLRDSKAHPDVEYTCPTQQIESSVFGDGGHAMLTIPSLPFATTSTVLPVSSVLPKAALPKGRHAA